MTYTAPDNILLVLRDLDFSQALAAGDPRYVETRAARGSEQTLQRFSPASLMRCWRLPKNACKNKAWRNGYCS